MELRSQRVLDEGRDLVGALRWTSTGPDTARGWKIKEVDELGVANDFARWIHGTGPVPGRGGRMSCEQAVMFTAYRAGAVDEATLRRWYAEAAEAARRGTSKAEAISAFNGKISEFLGPGERTPYRINIMNTGLGWPDIPGGHTVFFQGHTAISLGTRDARGRQEVLSHWIFPKATFFDSGEEKWGAMQKTSVEELLRVTSRHAELYPVESAAPSWLL